MKKVNIKASECVIIAEAHGHEGLIVGRTYQVHIAEGFGI
jgi:hypothetical protein